MLTKNIYILYPPGYSGSYINWAISKSDVDLATSTVDDPVNLNESIERGGVGTSHLHSRIPTHQNLQHHLIWVLYNKPVDKKIYIINSARQYNDLKRSEHIITMISKYDPTGVFIHIHDDDNLDNRKYGALNTIIKWPIYFKANQVLERKFKFDSFNCKDSLSARDTFYKNFKEIFPYSSPLDYKLLREKIKWFDDWYHIRNEFNPHEVNNQTYLEPSNQLPLIYQIGLTDIVSNNFTSWLDNFLSTSACCDYNTEYVKQYHTNYINAQPNLKWFDEINEFRKTRIITDYLKSHSLLQAFTLMEMLGQDSQLDYQNKPLEHIETH